MGLLGCKAGVRFLRGFCSYQLQPPHQTWPRSPREQNGLRALSAASLSDAIAHSDVCRPSLLFLKVSLSLLYLCSQACFCTPSLSLNREGLLMAETITIPSPSVFLRSPVQSSAAKPPAKTSPKRPSVSTKPSVNDQSQNNGVTKRKQSKSRNGQ